MAENLTDLMYKIIEHIEKERKILLFVSLTALVLVPIGLIFNIISFLLIFKNYRLVFIIARLLNLDGQSFRLGLVIINMLITSVLVFIGIKNIQFVHRWDKRLKEIANFEKQTYDELFKEREETDI
jgi:hypothetical protein